jgi:transcriptional regulator with XRE-family HTH domain
MNFQIFSERLKKLRQDHNLFQLELSKILSSTPEMISMIERQKCGISVCLFLKIADYFGVSADWILGRNENQFVYPQNTSANYRDFLNQRFREIRYKRKIKQEEAAKIMDVNRSFISHIEQNKSEISIEKLILAADFFDVSIDWFCGRTDDPNSHKERKNR